MRGQRGTVPLHLYWGKAGEDAESGREYHPLLCHCLDVAAVGKLLLAQDRPLLGRLAASTGLDASVLERNLLFLLALHDLGKLSVRFQRLCPDLLLRLQGRTSDKTYTGFRHDLLGHVLWREALLQALVDGRVLALQADPADLADLVGPLLSASAGHHGKPPGECRGMLREHFEPSDLEAALDLARIAADLFLPRGAEDFLPTEPYETLRHAYARLSYPVAGLISLCDWIASNRESFPYHDGPLDAGRYWLECALPRAERAVAASGVVVPEPCREGGLRHLFPAIGRPSPLQVHADAVAPGGPCLHIFEDLTGSGKTEAALAAASRIMAAGRAESVFVALPTMATSNAMYDRLAVAYRRLYPDDALPSLVLAHGARNLSGRFRASIGGRVEGVDQGQEQDETAGPAYCAAWLADNRKKSCLAAVGVGTVDQALLAVLPSRYQALRLLGLGRSVLVVDEVHAYDPYMHGLLKRLLAFHAAQGGSAILLSATLPRHMRRELVQAYSEGLGGPAPPLRRDDYPLATAVSRGQVEETPLDVREGTAREVAAELCHDEAAMLGEIRRAVSAGACCCWVRNTVGDASAACETLRRELPEARVGLFHARFAMCDRLSIEDDARSRFGPGSIQSEREGRVLVATQVVEQSLDLDFDLVLSDLAPIELLIQRAGRCCRHVREDRPAGYGRARLVVLSPEPEEECGADWYTGLFPQGAYVYPFHGRMWLAARLLAEKGSIRLPEDARFYLEAVYGETGEERMPARLLTAEARPEGDARAGASFAHMNGLKLDKGYMADGDDWIDDVRTPTRLGQASVTLRLGRREGGEVRPWAGGEPGATAWSLSEVSVRAARISAVQEPADKGLREAVARATETMPDKGKFSLLLPLSQDAEGAWHGEALDGHGNRVRVRYGETFGLTIEAIT